MIEELIDAAERLRSHGVRPGGEVVHIGTEMFGQLVRHRDVAEGSLEIVDTDLPDHFIVIHHAIKRVFRVVVISEPEHWVNRKAL